MDEKLKKDYIATIGVDVTTIKVPVLSDDKKKDIVTLTVWDLAGQKQFQNIRKQFYLGANAAFLIFDVSRKETFSNLDNWINELMDTISLAIPLILVGNKIDLLNREVTKEEMQKFPKNHPQIVSIRETSALTGSGIRDLFNSCGQFIYDQHKPPIAKDERESIEKPKKVVKKAPKKTTKREPSIELKPEEINKPPSTKKGTKKGSKKPASKKKAAKK